MIRYRYNRIPHPPQDTTRERNINTYNGIKYKSAQAESQTDNSFRADEHQAILNKANIKQEVK